MHRCLRCIGSGFRNEDIPRDKLLAVDVDIVACVVDIVNDIEVAVIVLQVDVQLQCNMEKLFH